MAFSTTALMNAGLVQGVGEGPDRILAGTKHGTICMWEWAGDPQQLPICWSLSDHLCYGLKLSCLAATDQVVVSGFQKGALQIMRIDSHVGQHEG